MEGQERDQARSWKYYDYVLLGVVVLVAAVIVVLRLKIQLRGGPGYDTYAFLNNALTMAGKSTYYEISRPPVMPFLTSIFFRLGWASPLVLYLIDGLVFIFGAAGLYLLARLRFSSLPSLVVSLIFISIPDVVENVAFGITDVFAISLSIWMIYLTILAVERNPRYYLIVPPLFIVAFLTRFTAAVMIFPILFYLFLRGNLLRNIRAVAEGLSLAALIVIADLAYTYQLAKGDVFVQFSAPYALATTTRIAEVKGLTGAPTGSRFYFVINFVKLLSPSVFGYLFAALFVAGVALFLTGLFRSAKQDKAGVAAVALSVGLLVAVYLVFSEINFVFADAIILAILLVVLHSWFDIDQKQAVSLVMFFWFITFLTYHSHQAVKVPRYFLTLTPTVAFFGAYAFDSVLNLLKRINLRKTVYVIVTILLMLGLLTSTGLATNISYQKIAHSPDWQVPGFQEASEWLLKHSKKSDLIYADNFVTAAWYMRRPIRAMQYFEDPRAFNHELEKYNADYFISIWHGEDFPSYYVLKKIGATSIYKRKSQPLPDKPRIFLIGKDTDHYIEDVLNFKFYVIRQKSPFPDDQNRSVSTTYIDDYRLETLRRYRSLLLYNFRWRDTGKADKLLTNYLASGGTIIVDASGNSGKSFYDLNNSTFLGVSVMNLQLSPVPKISIAPDYNLQTGVDTSKFARFVDENGEPWVGSAYQTTALAKEELKKLVTADGHTLVAVQQRGKGRIIWIGYNFVFHAFYHKNKAEDRLIQNVFRFAAK